MSTRTNKKIATNLLDDFLSVPAVAPTAPKAPEKRAVSFKLSVDVIDEIEEYVVAKNREVGRKNYSFSHFVREAIDAYLPKK